MQSLESKTRNTQYNIKRVFTCLQYRRPSVRESSSDASRLCALLNQVYSSQLLTQVVKSTFKICKLRSGQMTLYHKLMLSTTYFIYKNQRRTTTLICGPNLPYKERLKMLKWPSHKLQRRNFCLAQYYEILFRLSDKGKFEY